jgi:hypothetical protein
MAAKRPLPVFPATVALSHPTGDRGDLRRCIDQTPSGQSNGVTRHGRLANPHVCVCVYFCTYLLHLFCYSVSFLLMYLFTYLFILYRSIYSRNFYAFNHQCICMYIYICDYMRKYVYIYISYII